MKTALQSNGLRPDEMVVTQRYYAGMLNEILTAEEARSEHRMLVRSNPNLFDESRLVLRRAFRRRGLPCPFTLPA